jgi:hypothetical protein
MSNLSAGSKLPALAYLSDLAIKKPGTTVIERPYWFVLSQTDGGSVELPPTPGWDRSRALTALDIREVPFTYLDGNTLGYARGREIAINPLGPMPHETTFHEVAHILLGHGGEGESRDNRLLERNLKEVEAESVALLCCESLGLPGAEYARGYIQAWLRGEEIPEKSAQKIFHAADQILRAGQVVEDQCDLKDRMAVTATGCFRNSTATGCFLRH